MSDVSDTELFSAYLDGELTAEEQVRVEQILATSPEARQTVDELRALSGTLQALPQQKLDEDLSACVLAIAERRVLSPEEPGKSDKAEKPSAGRAAAAMNPPARDSHASEGFPWREISWRGMFSPRALIWSAIIVIVAVILHFKAPSQKPNQNIARNENGKAAAGSADVTKEAGDATSNGSWQSRDKPAADGPASEAKIVRLATGRAAKVGKKEADGKTADRTLANDLGADQLKGKAVEPEAAPAPAPIASKAEQPSAKMVLSDKAKSPASKDAAAAGDEKGNGEIEKPKLAIEGQAKLAPEAKPAGAPTVAKESPDAAQENNGKLAGGSHGASQGAGRKTMRHEQKHINAAPPDAIAKSEVAPLGDMAPKGGEAQPPGGGPYASPSQPAPLPGMAKRGEGEREAMLIVRLDVSAEAARREVFKELLVRNGLAVNESPQDNRRSPANVRDAMQDDREGFGGRQSSARQLGNGAAQPALSSSNSSTVENQNRSEQSAGQVPPEVTQNSASRAANTARRGAAPSATAPQAARAPQALPQTAAPQAPGATTWSYHQAPANGRANVLYFECDVTQEQLKALMTQLGSKRDAFSPPEIVTPAESQRQELAASGEQSFGGYNYKANRGQLGVVANGSTQNGAVTNGAVTNGAAQNGAAPSGAIQNAAKGAQHAPAKQSQLDAESNQPERSREVPAKPHAVPGAAGGQLHYQSLAPTPSATGAKTHVRFVLNVVDRVAPPPAPAVASPAPAAGR